MVNGQLQTKNIVNEDGIIIRPADWCVIIALICNFLILLGEPLKNSFILSLGSRGLIFSILGFALFQLVVTIQNKKEKNIYYLVAVIASAGVSALLSGVTAILQHLVPLICFFMLPISLLLYKKIYRVANIKTWIYRFNWLYTLLFTYLFFSPMSHVFYGEYGKETLDALTLGYANPNQTGIYLMISFIIAFSGFQRDMKKGRKIAYIIQSLWTFILVCQTLSRTCIILSIAIFLMWIFKRVSKVGNKFTIVCFALPLVMACLLIFGGDKVQDILIFNEEFDTGRIDLFKSVLMKLTPTTILFGNFSKWIGGNLHNSYFTVFAIFGLVGIVLYLVFLWKIVKDYFTQIDKKSPAAMLAYLGILAAIVHGSTESTLLTAGMIYGSLFSLLFILTLNENEETTE